MSFRRLQTNVARYHSARIQRSFSWTPVIITDSKGKHLRKHNTTADGTDHKIHWLGRKGFTSLDVVKFLSVSKLRSLLYHHRQISLYVFVGTCDFTSKGKRFIQLKKPTDQALRSYFQNLEILKKRCSGNRIKLTFLQVPYYSIEAWNKTNGHKRSELFRDDDKLLSKVIERANADIDRLNKEVGAYTPQFNQDLQRSRKRRGGKQRYSMKFALLTDGIHPGPKLARSWLTSIKWKINKYC